MSPVPIPAACGCLVTTSPGHVHTKLCALHRREAFGPPLAPATSEQTEKPEWDDL